MQDNTAFPDLAVLTPQQIETKAVEVGSVKAGMSPAKAFLLAIYGRGEQASPDSD